MYHFINKESYTYLSPTIFINNSMSKYVQNQYFEPVNLATIFCTATNEIPLE